MAGPGAEPATASAAETHISWVLFTADRAYKILKPMRTGFLDYSTPELREAACRREVELNSRLSPDVYLGVSPVLEHGEVVDHMVVMRRLPDSRRLSTLAASGEQVDCLRQVARAVAAFHAGLGTDPAAARAAGVDRLRRLWTVENLDQMTADDPDARIHDPVVLGKIRDAALTYLEGRRRLFTARVAAGFAVDGHGDLLAEDIFCLPDGPRILDCLAFDDELRRGDVLADVAFLAMDLERLTGGPAASDLLIALYDEFTAEHHPRSLYHFYVAQRALVRAKVRGLRALQAAGVDADVATGEARSFLSQCLGHLRAAAVRLVLIGGAPGTGKTTTANALADRLGATVLSSDEVRKDLAGVAHHDHTGAPLDESIYTPEWSRRCYSELLRRAEELLELGETVVLDASWQHDEHRRAARAVASGTSSQLAELRCVLEPVAAAERVGRRAQRRLEGGEGDASDATPAIAIELAQRFDPWPEAFELPTAGAPTGVLEQALDAIGIRVDDL